MSWVWHHKKASPREPDWNAPLPDSSNSRLEYLYAWERRCRGYDLHPYPVAIEPRFVPYRPERPQELSPPTPFQQPAGDLAHVSLQLPLEQKVTLASAMGLLSALPAMAQPLAFEIIASQAQITYQLTCPGPVAAGVVSALQMHWPKALFSEETDALKEGLHPWPEAAGGARLDDRSFVVEFGLQQFAYLPLNCFESLSVDPLAGVLTGLGTLEAHEVAGLQVLFTPASRSWNETLLQVAGEFDDPTAAARGQAGNRAHSFSSPSHDPALRAAQSKLAQPLFAVVVRVFAVCPDGPSRAFDLCKKIGSALGTFNHAQGQSGNALLALANTPSSYHAHTPTSHHPQFPASGCIQTVFERSSYRSGFLVSLPELAGLVHPPSEGVQHPKLLRLDPSARSLSEELLTASGVTLGLHPYRNQAQHLVWPENYRNRHAYILGATRMGKSTLLLNMMLQDIESGCGLCLIDPHGDLALDVLSRIPRERAGDVLYLDLADREYPLALGLLEATSEQERRLLCSDLLSVLRRLFASSWGDRLEHILRHAILTLLAAGDGAGANYTLRDIRPLLSNPAFRERVIDGLADPDLHAFWTSEFPGYSATTFAPIYNKLGLLISSPLVRNIIAGRQSKLSFADLIQKRQILLVNLAGSQIGNDQAHFLGALLVSKLQIAAMQSLRLGRDERTPFTLYVDEFQNFLVSSFETILSEAGKAGLSLVMANQFLEQLSSQLQVAILSNAGTLVSFRVSSDSGRLLEKEFAGRYKSAELVSLNRGEAIARVGSAADSYDIATLPPPTASPSTYAAVIKENSRSCICRPHAEVEAELAADARRQAEEQETYELAAAERKAAAKQSKTSSTKASSPKTTEQKSSAPKIAAPKIAGTSAAKADVKAEPDASNTGHQVRSYEKSCRSGGGLLGGEDRESENVLDGEDTGHDANSQTDTGDAGDGLVDGGVVDDGIAGENLIPETAADTSATSTFTRPEKAPSAPPTILLEPDCFGVADQ